jgi:hypothetical protein
MEKGWIDIQVGDITLLLSRKDIIEWHREGVLHEKVKAWLERKIQLIVA